MSINADVIMMISLLPVKDSDSASFNSATLGLQMTFLYRNQQPNSTMINFIAVSINFTTFALWIVEICIASGLMFFIIKTEGSFDFMLRNILFS